MATNAVPLKSIATKSLVVDPPAAPFRLRDVVLDRVQNGEVLVEIQFTGICHMVSGMDIHLLALF